MIRNKLKVYRAMYDLTQEELADKVRITRQTINALEKGKYYPSLELAFKLSRVFGVSVEEVFEYEDDEDDEDEKTKRRKVESCKINCRNIEK